MIRRRIEKIIAREGLIILGLGIVLYFSSSFLCRHIPAVFPKYQAEFANGKSYSINIYPDYYYAAEPKRELCAFFHPNQQIVQKRLNELIKREKIDSPLKSARLINPRQLYFSEHLFNLLSLNLFIKVALVYLLLTIIRFIVWAVRVLKKQ